MAISTYLSILTLIVNELHAPIKRHRLAKCIKKRKDLSICCIQETHFRPERHTQMNVKGWKKIFHASRNEKKPRVAIFIVDKIDLTTKSIIKDKKVHYVMTQESIKEEVITFVNIYVPNIGALKYIKQILIDIKGEIN